jgi:hypothetical protein
MACTSLAADTAERDAEAHQPQDTGSQTAPAAPNSNENGDNSGSLVHGIAVGEPHPGAPAPGEFPDGRTVPADCAQRPDPSSEPFDVPIKTDETIISPMPPVDYGGSAEDEYHILPHPYPMEDEGEVHILPYPYPVNDVAEVEAGPAAVGGSGGGQTQPGQAVEAWPGDPDQPVEHSVECGTVEPGEVIVGENPLPGAPAAPMPEPDYPVEVMPAPIVDAQIAVAESFPPQYFLHVRAALPNGCHNPGDHSWTRDGNEIHVTINNTVPAGGNLICTMIYSERDVNIGLGSDFEAGETYTVIVNGEYKLDFTA